MAKEDFDDDGARFVWPRKHTEENIIEMVSYVLSEYPRRRNRWNGIDPTAEAWVARILKEMPEKRTGRWGSWYPTDGD